jgi:transposase-like protein
MRSIPDPRDTWTPDEARQLLDEHGRVGGSLSEFARRHGISPARLYWWKKRLASEPGDLTALSLVPATVTTTGSELAAITIRLPNGITLESTNTAPAWIAAVVAELSRSS